MRPIRRKNTTLLSPKQKVKSHDLYVIYNPENERIKVGRTTNILSRFSNLKTLSGCEQLSLEYLIKDCGDYEKYCHFILQDAKITGEWFEHLFCDSIDVFRKCLEGLTTFGLSDCKVGDYQINPKNQKDKFIDLLEHLIIYKNEFLSQTTAYSYDKLFKLTRPYHDSAKLAYETIKKERHKIGRAIKTPFIDFLRYRKLEFKNFTFLIHANSIKQSYEIYSRWKEPSKDSSKQVIIEQLKMNKNVVPNETVKSILQQAIDALYNL